MVPFLPAAFDPAATAESTRAAAEYRRTTMVSSSDAEFEPLERGMLATMTTDPAQQDVVLGWAMHSDRAAIGEAISGAVRAAPRGTAITWLRGTWRSAAGGRCG
jgi:hypothetical protein